MFLVKVLENKLILRIFGAALVLSPIVNTLVKMALLPDIPNRWSMAMFWRIIAVGSIPNQILYVATVIIGFLMMRGTAAVWKYVLLLLGGYIMLQISDFKQVKSSSVTWLFFITNILTFMFVADQLVWKVKSTAQKPKPEPKAMAASPVKPPPTPPPKVEPQTVAMKSAPKPNFRVIPKVRKKILFQFADGNPWGQLMGISSQGLHVRQLAEPPVDIATREIEITLKSGLTLRARLARRNEQEYFFNYSNISAKEIQSLNKWLHSLSNAA